MAEFYEEMTSAVAELLAEFGLPVKVTRSDGTAVGSGYGVFVENNNTLDSKQEMQTVTSLKTLLISHLPQDVQVGDRVVIDKLLYIVSSVATIRPANKSILYRCEVVYG